MPASSHALAQRLFRLVRMFLHEPYRFTKAEIMREMQYYGRYDDQMLYRDRGTLRDEYFISIDPDEHHVYEINKSPQQLEDFMEYLEILSVSDFLREAIKGNSKSLEYFDFHQPIKKAIGLDLLKPLLGAIQERSGISFWHYNYLKETRKFYELAEPLMLKEYFNRWYLVAYVPKLEAMRTFGLDRLEELVILNQKCPDRKLKPKSQFKDIIGLDYNGAELTRIRLAFSERQWKYAKALPLHRSQTLVPDLKHSEEHPVVAQYYLRPNYELTQEILKLGSQVVVLEPKSLRDAVQQELKSSLKKYSS